MNKTNQADGKYKNQNEITVMNCIFCMIVMFIHVSSIAVSTASKETVYYFLLVSASRSSAFVVQGFVFLSSFKLFCNKIQPQYIPYVLGKVQKIYIPYLIWNTIYYFNFMLHGYFQFFITDLITYCVNGTLSSPFYFVVFIMQFYILLPLWWKIYSSFSPLIVIPISFFLTLYSSEIIQKLHYMAFDKNFNYPDRIFITYLLYWTLGAYVAKYRDKLLPLLAKKYLVITLIYCFFATVNIGFYYNLVRFGNFSPIIHLVLVCYCVSAIAFFLCLSQKIPLTKSIQHLSNVTFAIYLNHCFILFYVDKLSSHLNFNTIKIAFLFRFIALYAVAITLNLFWFQLKNRRILHD